MPLGSIRDRNDGDGDSSLRRRNRNQIEVGAKWEPVGFNGYLTAAWFDLRKTNALMVDPTNIFARSRRAK